jgi:tetratricopeptide (TPR) repeat protein
MTRDHGLFALVGVLIGFIAGYMMHEVMAARQPARLPLGANTAAVGAPANPAASTQAQGEAQMQQIQELSEYVRNNPDDLNATLRLANFAFDAQIWPRAAELYEIYVASTPGDADVLTDLGVCRREMGQAEDALASFDLAIAADGEHWQSQFNRVVVLTFDLERFDQAREGLAILQAIQPGNESVARLSEELERRANGMPTGESPAGS